MYCFVLAYTMQYKKNATSLDGINTTQNDHRTALLVISVATLQDFLFHISQFPLQPYRSQYERN